jgi:hypothetical protein
MEFSGFGLPDDADHPTSQSPRPPEILRGPPVPTLVKFLIFSIWIFWQLSSCFFVSFAGKGVLGLGLAKWLSANGQWLSAIFQRSNSFHPWSGCQKIEHFRSQINCESVHLDKGLRTNTSLFSVTLCLLRLSATSPQSLTRLRLKLFRSFGLLYGKSRFALLICVPLRQSAANHSPQLVWVIPPGWLH